jgi:hypothetical protein
MFLAIPSARGAAVGSFVSNTFKSAALDLNFASTKSLVDSATGQNLVTFTRASSATFIDSAGTLQTAVTNLLLRSEEIGTSPWGTNISGSVTYTANAITSPVGSITADRVTATTDFAGPNQFVSATLGLPYTFSFYIKAVSAGVKDQIRIELFSGRFAQFRISTLAFSSVNPGITATSAQAVGDGWVRVVLTTLAPSTGSLATAVYANTDADFYLWGAQLEQSSTVGEYIPTTSAINSAPRFDHNPTTGESLGLLVEEQRTNLLLRSEEFDNASWSKPQSDTITANSIASPTGATTADSFVENTASGAVHTLLQDGTIVANSTNSFSCFFKSAGRTQILIKLSSTDEINGCTGTFDLSVGTAAAVNFGTGSGATASIQAFPSGWYRCVINGNIGSALTTVRIRIRPLSGGNEIYTGNGATAYYIWGAQLEAGAFPTSYIPTTTVAVTRSADVASITGANFGTTRTNYIRNNTMVGAVAGTPGTLPTNWARAASPTNGISSQVVGTGTESGVTYLDLRFTGTCSTTFGFSVDTDTSSAAAAATGQAWTSSVYLTRSAGTIGNATVQLVLNEYSSVPAFLRNTFSSSVVPAASNLATQRITQTVTAGASTAFVQQSLSVNFTNGNTYDFTLRIGLPQLELGNTATAVIPTTTAAVSVFESSWYRQDEGTAFVDVLRSYSGNFPAFPNIITFSDGTTNNLWAMYGVSGSQAVTNFSLQSGGVGQTDYVQVATNVPGPNRIAQALAVNSSTFAANGALTLQDSSVAMPVGINRVSIGADRVSLAQWGGHIRRLTYWPQRLANSTLQSITL